jgi:hypothetical protein
LQSGIVVNDTFIQGTLNHVTGYTGFSGTEALQSGNYLALKFAHSEGATTTVEILGGTTGAVTLDSDMNWVGRISNNTQRVKVVTTLGTESVTKIYSLRSLVLESA